MKVAIMQPYFFPYIGYFQMIKAVDTFVFYDDVNYINRGWINRNRILINKEANYITVPLIKSSQNKLINEVTISKSKEYYNIIKTIENTYRKAPFFEVIFPLIDKTLNTNHSTISELSIDSIRIICEYLQMNTKFLISSKSFPETKGLEKTQRLISICQKLNANEYINAVGGQEIYKKEDFKQFEIDLHFISPKLNNYKQFGKEFVPWLSIIDIMMFNSPKEIKIMLEQFELI